MLNRKLKSGVFVLEWLNIYAVIYYLFYLFFFLKEDFGFTNRDNLLFAALNGLIYIPAAWFGGQVAQKHGYFFALRIGFGAMALALAVGSQWPTIIGQTVVMAVWTVGTCFTWPALEALVSENETRRGLSRMIGLYNVVWASGAAAASFTGGVLLHWLGRESLFWLPVGLHAAQFILAWWLERKSKRMAFPSPAPAPALDFGNAPEHPLVHASVAGTAVLETVAAPPRAEATPVEAKLFLRLAWLANPFAYIAMNTVIPLVPDLAGRLGLTTTLAGFVGSVWMFARLFAFAALWRWTGWHYRFGWLIGAYVAMVLCFAALLIVPNLAVIIVAQFIFGLAVGLIYYSSLFYSMDVGDTKGEHGGFHEALIGTGIFLGPAVGAAAIQFAPRVQNAGILTVTALLMAGFGLLVLLKRRK